MWKDTPLEKLQETLCTSWFIGIENYMNRDFGEKKYTPTTSINESPNRHPLLWISH